MTVSRLEVLAIEDAEQLRFLSVEWFRDREMTQAEFEHISSLCGSTWKYSGDPKKPHAILTSGKHSNGFIDTLAMLTYPNVCEILASELVRRISGVLNPDWIVGSDHASAVFSAMVAKLMREQGRGYPRYDFCEKGKDIVGEDIQRWERFTIGKSQTVLNVEELMSTSKTVMLVRAGIRRFHLYPINFLPVILVLVNRTGVTEIDGNKLISPFTFNFDMYPADACPMCAAGSKPIKEPKKHWAELTK